MRATRRLVHVMVLAALAAAPALALALAADKKPIPVSDEIDLKGNIEHPRVLRLADLQAETATTVQVFFSTGSGPVGATFTGVPLWALLQKATIKPDPNVNNGGLQHTLAVAATDGYRVVFSTGELDPKFGAAGAVLAYAQDGKPLDAQTGGFARLILPGDKAGGRNVSSVVSIEVQ
ncbi:MAG: molybdopterin-dependent oxidoreductase [Geminicoccaceae bacterium]